MRRIESGAPWVRITGPRIIIPEIIANKSARFIHRNIWPKGGQSIVHTSINQRNLGIAGHGVIWFCSEFLFWIYNDLLDDGLKVGPQIMNGGFVAIFIPDELAALHSHALLADPYFGVWASLYIVDRHHNNAPIMVSWAEGNGCRHPAFIYYWHVDDLGNIRIDFQIGADIVYDTSKRSVGSTGKKKLTIIDNKIVTEK